MTGHNAEQKPGSNSEKDSKTVRKMKERQVHKADQALLPTLTHSFIACGRMRVPHAPAAESFASVLQDGSHTQGPEWGKLTYARPIESCSLRLCGKVSRSISSSVQGCRASGSASAAAYVVVDGVASRCPRVGLDAIEREEVLSRVRRARFLSGGDGGVGGVQ